MLTEKEISYFNDQLKIQNLEIVESPEYWLLPDKNYQGYYTLKFRFMGIMVESVAVKTVVQWSTILCISMDKFIISVSGTN